MGLLLFACALAGLVLWFRADWRYFNRWSLERDRLEREGRWAELRACIEGHYRSWRPFVRILGQMPRGLAEAKHALALHNLGDHETALAINERALGRVDRPRMRSNVLATRALIFSALRRYDDARALVSEIAQLRHPHGLVLNAIAVSEMNRGRLDEALQLLRPLLEDAGAPDPQIDPVRQTAALVLAHKGEPIAALALLDAMGAPRDPFRDIDTSFSREFAIRIERDRARSLDAQRTLRLLARAQVHVMAEDATRALETLESCAEKDWARPVVESVYQRLMARASSLRGDAAKSDAHLERLRQLNERQPRPILRAVDHGTAGTCALELGRLDEALALLTEALAGVRHPLERHVITFRLAQTHERAGRAAEAEEAYRVVVADGFPTQLGARAAATLRRSPTAG